MQKPAYEMRLSDWSSDVCSSDLRAIIELPDGRTLDARVRAVTPGLGGETRSATAVLDVTGILQPGLAVRVRLLPSRGEVSDAIVLSEDALHSIEGRDVVFVRINQISEVHTSELQSLMRIPYAVFCLQKHITHIITYST